MDRRRRSVAAWAAGLVAALLCLCLLRPAQAEENADWTTTSAGNIRINANLASSAPLLRASVEALVFRWSEDAQASFDKVLAKQVAPNTKRSP